ncbi:hypothetical protein BKA63DRAFT_597627 [Paraphoma chrysanthemicola]|nr:hypothetical protein BKA63DRAFT_597627 [Paraphoma chrysanthemicola]
MMAESVCRRTKKLCIKRIHRRRLSFPTSTPQRTSLRTANYIFFQFGRSTISKSFFTTTLSTMVSIKSLNILALASFALAAPQANGKQAAKVAELEAEGLNCKDGPQGTIICSDGTGAGITVNTRGGTRNG